MADGSGGDIKLARQLADGESLFFTVNHDSRSQKSLILLITPKVREKIAGNDKKHRVVRPLFTSADLMLHVDVNVNVIVT